MNHKITSGGLVSLCLMVAFTILLTSVPAEAAHCSTAASAGMWDYTYTGTIFTSSGPLPAASVGHFRQDAAGKLTGSQTRSVAGGSGVEDISGNITVRGNCTATATIIVLVKGELQRTAVLAVTFDNNMNHGRGIFKTLVLPDGTNVPVVITSDNTRVFPKN
jgi:hypothetical protein